MGNITLFLDMSSLCHNTCKGKHSENVHSYSYSTVRYQKTQMWDRLRQRKVTTSSSRSWSQFQGNINEGGVPVTFNNVWNDGVKGIACSDEPTGIFQLYLPLPSALQRFIVSFSSLFSYLDAVLLFICSHCSHRVVFNQRRRLVFTKENLIWSTCLAPDSRQRSWQQASKHSKSEVQDIFLPSW